MKQGITRALGALGSALALSLVCLAGTGSAATASPAAAKAAGVTSAGALSEFGGFQPAAASFTSPNWGVALGSAAHTGRALLAVTADGGRHWSPMRAPNVRVGNGGAGPSQVSQVAFANRADGWLYSQYGSGHVWVTHDGGASWRELTLPASIKTMAASANAVYAAAGGHLYQSPLGRDAWRLVSAGRGASAMTGTTLAVSGDSAWFGSSTSLWTTSDGVHWRSYPLRSPGAYYGRPYDLAGIAAASPRSVAFLWAAPTGMFRTGMEVLASFNGGRTQRPTLTVPPSAGDVAAFAVSPGRLDVISVAVVTPGLDNVYRLAGLGRTWTTYPVPGTGGGDQLGSLRFVSPSAGFLVTGGPASAHGGQLLRTIDAGRTWHPVRF
jgi:photosystem II stability/assembly factor-like uncharacterized protein